MDRFSQRFDISSPRPSPPRPPIGFRQRKPPPGHTISRREHATSSYGFAGSGLWPLMLHQTCTRFANADTSMAFVDRRRQYSTNQPPDEPPRRARRPASAACSSRLTLLLARGVVATSVGVVVPFVCYIAASLAWGLPDGRRPRQAPQAGRQGEGIRSARQHRQRTSVISVFPCLGSGLGMAVGARKDLFEASAFRARSNWRKGSEVSAGGTISTAFNLARSLVNSSDAQRQIRGLTSASTWHSPVRRTLPVAGVLAARKAFAAGARAPRRGLPRGINRSHSRPASLSAAACLHLPRPGFRRCGSQQAQGPPGDETALLLRR